MRIGIDYRPVTAAPYSGIARQVLALEQAILAGENAQLYRFTAAPLEHAHRLLAHCPATASPVHGLHRPRERVNFELRFLPAAIATAELDIYIATANTGLPVWRAPANTRYVLLLHDVFQLTMANHHSNRIKALVYRQIDRVGISSSVALADAIWTPSVFTADQARRLFPAAADKISVLPNAVPALATPEPLCAFPALPAVFWLVVGTREPRKNIPWFVQCWQQARQQDASVPALVMVGSASDLPLELRDADGMFFVSGLSDAELLSLYAQTRCLWQPSLAEGFGLPVLEALAQGAAVAVARGSALDEICPAESPRFSPQDSAGLQQLMLELAARPQPMRWAARQTWADQFAMPAYTKRVQALLQGVLSMPR
ncbi:glycosyltransferase family 1 protein [Iodobacter sp. CM08]|uniref:glycosyltransferase family 4 protein n=1 Tax=Iodobacter sp. CM08 TaxID=3085902 RepID=UPI002981F80E|nr:glycosyltransferase family 1 protein [Iodobacter sp. CM08]MDW5419022.1 glycosyltransferase family 1 protein [Iodobacter sp. CM08]